MSYQRGDVVWGPDPFKSGENPRPWLILNNDSHPFGDEEYMTVTLTTTAHDEGLPLEDANWIEGGMPNRATPHRGQSHHRSTPRSFGVRVASKSRSSRRLSMLSDPILNHPPGNNDISGSVTVHRRRNQQPCINQQNHQRNQRQSLLLLAVARWR